ncbi:unnamed protein product [Alopecurus aequalis]
MMCYMFNFEKHTKAATLVFLLLFVLGCLTCSAHGDENNRSGGRRFLHEETGVSNKISLILCVRKSCWFCTKFCCETLSNEPCWHNHEDCLQNCPKMPSSVPSINVIG